MGLTTEIQDRYALKKCERNIVTFFDIILFISFLLENIWAGESESLDM